MCDALLKVVKRLLRGEAYSYFSHIKVVVHFCSILCVPEKRGLEKHQQIAWI